VRGLQHGADHLRVLCQKLGPDGAKLLLFAEPKASLYSSVALAMPRSKYSFLSHDSIINMLSLYLRLTIASRGNSAGAIRSPLSFKRQFRKMRYATHIYYR
jgi:hypothetical protein